MTSPNLGVGSTDDYTNVANAIGLAAMQAMSANDILEAQLGEVAGPLGHIAEWVVDGIGTIIADIQAFITTGDTANLNAAAGFVQSKIEGLLGEVLRVLDAIWEAMIGEYEGDEQILLFIQNLFYPLRKLIEVVGGVAAGLIPSASQVAAGWSSLSTMLNQIADIFNGLVVTPINTAVAGVLDWFTGLLGWKSSTTASVSANTAAISSASAAALAANNNVEALITGGVRTIYTSSTTWTKPVGAVKIGVVCIGAGGGGQDAQRLDSGSRAFGGGYAYSEFPADALPSTVALTVPLGRAHNILGPGVASFGTYLESPVNGSGFIKTYSGRTAVLNAPGHPGALCEETGPAGSAGPLGGSPTTGTSTSPAGAGENGDTTGIDITGAGGGGGGNSEASGAFGGATSEGGPGGFPGGPGGQGGTTGLGTARNGGAGGGALVAVIVW